MSDTCSTDSAASIDRSAVDKLLVPSIDSPAPKSGSASGERPFLKPQHQKTDAEAVQDWESEGGASTHPSEDDLAQIERNNENIGRNVDSNGSLVLRLRTRMTKRQVSKKVRDFYAVSPAILCMNGDQAAEAKTAE